MYAVTAARDAARAPRELGTLALESVRGVAAMRGLLRPTPRSTLNGPIGPHRRWNWARAQLSDVKSVRAGLGGTVNDVVLAAITRGFRELLLARGEDVEGRVVRTLVPVSVRRRGERGTYNNASPPCSPSCPWGSRTPSSGSRPIREQMEGLKESKQAVAGEVLTSLTGFAPALLLALGARVASRRAPQRNVNTVTTNVPGPQRPLYLAGRRMLEAMPFVPLGGQVRVGVAIFSYDGALKFGVTGDYDTAPDIGVLCTGIETGLAELVKAAAAGDPAPKRPAGGRAAKAGAASQR